MRGERRLEPLKIGREHRVPDARLPPDARHDVGGVRHLRHPFPGDEGRGLDRRKSGGRQRVDQRDLGIGRNQRLLVLQAVARTDFDEPDRRRELRAKSHGSTQSGSVASNAIDDAGHLVASLEAPDLRGNLRDRRVDHRHGRRVRRQRDTRMMPERMTGRQRLGAKDVERGAGKVAFVQQCNEVFVHDDVAPRHVDDVSATRQARQSRAVEKVPGIGCGRQQADEHARRRKKAIELAPAGEGSDARNLLASTRSTRRAESRTARASRRRPAPARRNPGSRRRTRTSRDALAAASGLRAAAARTRSPHGMRRARRESRTPPSVRPFRHPRGGSPECPAATSAPPAARPRRRRD